MTSENPKHHHPEGNACWLSVDILVEHFPHLENEICLLDDSDIAYIDKRASEMNQFCYWDAMEIILIEYFEDKNKNVPEEDEGLESGME